MANLFPYLVNNSSVTDKFWHCCVILLLWIQWNKHKKAEPTKIEGSQGMTVMYTRTQLTILKGNWKVLHKEVQIIFKQKGTSQEKVFVFPF